jgi:hypothetical protein
MEKMFFDTKTKQCVIIAKKQLYCSHCKKELSSFFMVQRSYSKILPPQEVFFCSLCGKHNMTRGRDFFSIASKETSIRDTYKVINEHVPEVGKGEIDLFNACHLQSDNTIDNTVHSKHESIDGATIGDSYYIDKEDRKLIYEPEIDRFLDNIKNAKPVLPKQLEEKHE